MPITRVIAKKVNKANTTSINTALIMMNMMLTKGQTRKLKKYGKIYMFQIHPPDGSISKVQ